MWGAVGRSNAIRCIEAALMHQPTVKAAPRTGQLKERGGCVPPRKAQEGVPGRWDLAR
jgi:hypothetical protein